MGRGGGCDRRRSPNDTGLILERLADVPLTRWNYINDPNKREYIGPMAQDFHAAFALGDDTRINTLDFDGVALAAIQGLNRRVKEQRALLIQKDTEIAELTRGLAELRAMVLQLAMKVE